MVSSVPEAGLCTYKDFGLFDRGIALDDFSCVGRNEELKNMERFLVHQIPYHTITLNGLGGMGKTHLAMEYIERHPNYTVIFWFDATDEATLGKDFVQMAARAWKEKKSPSCLGRIARDMNVEEATKWAMGWLSRRGNKK
ncbi:hypothetical protein N7488_005126 [Penicillium malachiteum]|nr:hypothetical protein N7488_005126 [Penicillium malachiteum]